jgi:hypothetical protein
MAKKLLESLSKKELSSVYWDEGLTQTEIAARLGCSRTTITRGMQKLGIATDKGSRISKTKIEHEVTLETRRKLSEKHKGLHTNPASEFKTGSIPWNKGKPMPREIVEKIAARKRGIPSWNKSVSLNQWMSEESNQRRKAQLKAHPVRYWLGKKRPDISEMLRKGHQEKMINANILSWQDPLQRAKRIAATLKGLKKRPTKPEQRVIDIIGRFHLPYVFTGDGSIIIAGLSPDFINYNGAKKIIEVFGVAFHDPQRSFKHKVPLNQQEPYRRAIYSSFGFDCLILWDDELKKLSDNEIAHQIEEFTGVKEILHLREVKNA